MLDNNDLKKWIDGVKTSYDGNQLSVQMYFMYHKDGQSGVKDILLCDFETDDDIKDSMISRLQFVYSKNHLSKYEFKNFDLIESNEKTYYICPVKKFNNLQIGLNRMLQNNPNHDTLDIDNFSNTYGLLIKLYDTKENSTSYAFINITTFNSLRKKKLSAGMLARLTNNVKRREVKALDDSNLFFGVRNNVDFIYFDGKFVINPKGKSFFEQLFSLNEEYKKMASQAAKKLNNYNKTLINVEQLENDIKEDKTPFANQMLSKIGETSYFENLKSILEDKQKFSERLKEIENFQKDSKYKKDFKDLKIDPEKSEIIYSKENIYAFIAVLSDRPTETILLKRKKLGNI